MSNLIITGHGSYGSSIERSLKMICGETTGMYFIDFTEQDSLSTLNEKLDNAINQCKNEEILFCCDLPGGSPFNECMKRSFFNDSYETVAGLNFPAYADIAFSLELSAAALAERAVETTKETVQWLKAE